MWPLSTGGRSCKGALTRSAAFAIPWRKHHLPWSYLALLSSVCPHHLVNYAQNVRVRSEVKLGSHIAQRRSHVPLRCLVSTVLSYTVEYARGQGHLSLMSVEFVVLNGSICQRRAPYPRSETRQVLSTFVRTRGIVGSHCRVSKPFRHTARNNT